VAGFVGKPFDLLWEVPSLTCEVARNGAIPTGQRVLRTPHQGVFSLVGHQSSQNYRKCAACRPETRIESEILPASHRL